MANRRERADEIRAKNNRNRRRRRKGRTGEGVDSGGQQTEERDGEEDEAGRMSDRRGAALLLVARWRCGGEVWR